MNSFSHEDLLAAGYLPGPLLEAMLRQADGYRLRGISDPKYVLKLLRRDFEPPPAKFVLREAPAPLDEAIRAVTADEQANLAATRKAMEQLLLTPVISRGTILPDACPAGKAPATIPVGGAIAVENAIIPSAHSADICCSMWATFYDACSTIAEEMDALMAATRFGAGPRPADDLVDDPVLDEPVWENPFLSGLRDRAHAYLADQGDGNHFAFLGEMEVTPDLLATLDESGHATLAARLAAGPRRVRVLVTHHGSRGLGAHVFKRGQTAALKHVARVAENIPEAAAWLDFDSDAGRDYWAALQYVARWTRANHHAIHRRFLERIGATGIAAVGNEHNFVWKRGATFLHGKGATPAWKDEQGRPLLGLIPLNMAEPILLVLGGDNDRFLSFAPHGAGRNLSRTALRRKFPDPEQRRRQIEDSTRGIDVRWYGGKPDVSETPVAYKDAAAVKAQIEEFGLAKVIAEIRPLGCIMAGESDHSWRDDDELTPKQIRQIAHRAERRKVRQELHDPKDDA